MRVGAVPRPYREFADDIAHHVEQGLNEGRPLPRDPKDKRRKRRRKRAKRTAAARDIPLSQLIERMADAPVFRHECDVTFMPRAPRESSSDLSIVFSIIFDRSSASMP